MRAIITELGTVQLCTFTELGLSEYWAGLDWISQYFKIFPIRVQCSNVEGQVINLSQD
jgi:hypothetical protein